jgi:hypothetical protein
MLWFNDRIAVPRNQGCERKSLMKFICQISIHPSSTKMYHNLKVQFWWTRIEHETTRYVVECDTCQRSKAYHLRPADLLQPLNTPTWKWEDISIYFIVGIPLTAHKYDSIWVIVDRFMKSASLHPCSYLLQGQEICRAVY